MKKVQFLSLILLGVFIIALNACTKDNIDEIQPPVVSVCSDSILYSYTNDVIPALTDNGGCLVYCHSAGGAADAGGGIILEGYDNMFNNKDRVLGSIKHEPGFNPMPLGGNKISDEAIQIVECWIEQGALNN